MIFPVHKCGLFLTHNEHRDYYETAEQTVINNSDVWSWESDEAKARAIATDDIWEIQWYPDTPIGSYSLAAPTLDELLAFALKVEQEEIAKGYNMGRKR